MKMRRPGFIFSIAIALVLGWYLSAWSETQKEDRKGYTKEVQKKLKVLDKKIDELKAKAAEMKGEARTEFTKDMSEAAQETEGREKGLEGSKARDCQ